ncbi:ester cyclase [Nocardia vaccinii]|uniref:ester cyclase n=1 Tax=Nocardia vaccinii TaxID=1822 RepID=UPI00082D1574|nr:nuclear transport factor 2 family protein [Nocardia vaccinii]
MATADDPGTLVRRMLECFNTRRFDNADELMAPDFYSHPLGATGFEAGKNAWHSLVTRFPDIRIVPEDILVDGEKVAVRSSVAGIPRPEGGPPPMMIEIFRIADGRIAENWAVGQGLPYSSKTL